MNINLHIERLVLDGLALAPNQRQLLQASIEAELSRLLTESGLAPQLSQGLAVPKLKTDGINFHPGSNPVQLGQEIAASVYSGIGNSNSASGSRGS